MTLTKKQKIEKLFKKSFICDDFFKFNTEIHRFSCCNEKDCALVKDQDSYKEPIWSPAFGSENATVMLVAEAPSTTGGIGPHLGGLFECWKDKKPEKKLKGVLEFRDFFSGVLGFTPYFTDLVKCGPPNTGNKTLIIQRAKKCVGLFLMEEIKIIKPKYIYCIGKLSYTFLLAQNNEIKKINDNFIGLVPLIHYSSQAGLPLTPNDKKRIWEWQLRGVSKKQVDDLSLKSLSFFNK